MAELRKNERNAKEKRTFLCIRVIGVFLLSWMLTQNPVTFHRSFPQLLADSLSDVLKLGAWKQKGKNNLAQQVDSVKCPQTFSTAYPEATFKVITPQNIDEFLL